MNETIKDIISNIKGKLLYQFGKTLEKATPQELYKAVALTVRDSIMPKWNVSREALENPRVKKLYYLSVEFLLGRSLSNNMINIMQSDEYREALSRLGLSLEQIEEFEADPGLGNGGLGRLAACFLDSLATLRLPAMGCGIRYEYGLFRQKIVDGEQVEVPDTWLDDGNIWEVERPESAVDINFGGEVKEIWENGKLRIEHTGYHTVRAVPYDMPVVGYDSSVINTLRLWSARSPKHMDMESFSRGEYIKAMAEKELAEVISKVLYPADTHYEGKELRLKQHYFFTSATMQYIVSDALRCGADLRRLYDTTVIQINDTHPALAIPELMRILMDEHGFDWDSAWDVTGKVFAYTNHTVMSEALERWPVDLFKKQLPRIYSIICAINEHYCRKLWAFYPGQWEKIGQMAILGYGEIRMANLCVAMSFHVNGVSQLHANILQRTLFRDFFVIEPYKFSGITNGITHRRWLMDANPLLTNLISETIGDRWKKEPERLSDLARFASDPAFCQRFMDIKRQNKVRFSNWLHGHQNALLDPDSIFDVHAKRLHEYKRQLLNVLHILYLYDKLASGQGEGILPQTFLFGAKASPGYQIAKLIIKLINAVAAMVDATPAAREKLKVVFLENYNVSSAELLIPAANISEQISTAGKEASGTGNMKFMMNGALTLGTLDGANVEMYEALGEDNIIIFGHTTEEVERLYKYNAYSAGHVYETNAVIRRVLDYLISGALTPGAADTFNELYHILLFGGNGGMADPYLVLEDFTSYLVAHETAQAAYRDGRRFARMCVMNTAQSGIFSSDRTIREYNDTIWRLSPL